MNYLTTIAFHRDNPIYERDLKAYTRDSRRALVSRGKLRRNRIYGHLASILNGRTLANSSVSLLALVGMALLGSRCIYV